jgi:hypothetical protein
MKGDPTMSDLEAPKKYTAADNILLALDIASDVIVWGVGIIAAVAWIVGFAWVLSWVIWTATGMAFGDYRVWVLVGMAIFMAAACRVVWRW